MKAKEEELNSIIMELRKTIEALQEKCAKEESAKLVGLAGQRSCFFILGSLLELSPVAYKI